PLLIAPIVPGAPVRDQLFHGVQGNAVFPTGAIDLVRPACASQAVLKITQDRILDRDLERLDPLPTRSPACELLVRPQHTSLTKRHRNDCRTNGVAAQLQQLFSVVHESFSLRSCSFIRTAHQTSASRSNLSIPPANR